MTKVHVRGRAARQQSIVVNVDRELAELKAGLARLERSLADLPRTEHPAPKQNLPRRIRKPRSAAAPKPAPVVSALSVTPPPSTSAKAAAPVPAAASLPAWPTGSDLSDPKNFGLRPPIADLEQGGRTAEQHRQSLLGHIAATNQVLHTSGVVAAVWREWRAFERAAQERLRELTAPPPQPQEAE